jgi:hypothetical protein
MSSGGIAPPRVSQVKQVARATSSSEFAGSHAPPKVAPLSSSVPKEEPSVFSSFFGGAAINAPVLSFTNGGGGIETSFGEAGEDEEDEKEELEEVEWQWSAPSFEPSSSSSLAISPPREEEQPATSSMLIDLNAAFGAAFGNKADAPVPKRKVRFSLFHFLLCNLSLLVILLSYFGHITGPFARALGRLCHSAGSGRSSGGTAIGADFVVFFFRIFNRVLSAFFLLSICILLCSSYFCAAARRDNSSASDALRATARQCVAAESAGAQGGGCGEERRQAERAARARKTALTVDR